MYEELIAFLLGKKEDFTDEDLNEFLRLLAETLSVAPEYEMFEKQAIVESMMDRVEIKEDAERDVVGRKMHNLFDIERMDERKKRPARAAKRNGERLFNLRKPLCERLSSDGSNREREAEISKSIKKELSNNDGAKRTKRDGLANVFDEEFSVSEMQKQNRQYMLKITRGGIPPEDEFPFDLGTLEEHSEDGPIFHFDLDEK